MNTPTRLWTKTRDVFGCRCLRTITRLGPRCAAALFPCNSSCLCDLVVRLSRFCLCVCLSVCLSVCVSVCLSVCLSVSVSVFDAHLCLSLSATGRRHETAREEAKVQEWQQSAEKPGAHRGRGRRGAAAQGAARRAARSKRRRGGNAEHDRQPEEPQTPHHPSGTVSLSLSLSPPPPPLSLSFLRNRRAEARRRACWRTVPGRE